MLDWVIWAVWGMLCFFFTGTRDSNIYTVWLVFLAYVTWCVLKFVHRTEKKQKIDVVIKRRQILLAEERYNRKSTIITTNLDYDEWYDFLGNKKMAEALLSRLRHHCKTIRIKGPPLRKSDEEEGTTA